MLLGKFYKNEKSFKADFIKWCRLAHMFVTPIQTRTIPGVPDLFISTARGGLWVEVKYVDHPFHGYAEHKIPFRPGQQGWALLNYKACRSTEAVICVVCFQNEVYAFQQTKLWDNNIVPASEFKSINIDEQECCLSLVGLGRGHGVK